MSQQSSWELQPGWVNWYNGCALLLFQSLALATATSTLHLGNHSLTSSSL